MDDDERISVTRWLADGSFGKPVYLDTAFMVEQAWYTAIERGLSEEEALRTARGEAAAAPDVTAAGDGPHCLPPAHRLPVRCGMGNLLNHAQAMDSALSHVRLLAEAARGGAVPAADILRALNQPYRFPLPGDAGGPRRVPEGVRGREQGDPASRRLREVQPDRLRPGPVQRLFRGGHGRRRWSAPGAGRRHQ